MALPSPPEHLAANNLAGLPALALQLRVEVLFHRVAEAEIGGERPARRRNEASTDGCVSACRDSFAEAVMTVRAFPVG